MESGVLKQCPICGSTEIKQGKQVAHARMMPMDKIFATGSDVIADICTDCGHILSMRVAKPEKFK